MPALIPAQGFHQTRARIDRSVLLTTGMLSRDLSGESGFLRSKRRKEEKKKRNKIGSWFGLIFFFFFKKRKKVGKIKCSNFEGLRIGDSEDFLASWVGTAAYYFEVQAFASDADFL